MSNDPLNPLHYTNTQIEPLDVVEDWVLPYHLGCAVAYIKRYRDKENQIQDLLKALCFVGEFVALLIKIQHGGRRITKDERHALFARLREAVEEAGGVKS